MLGVMMKAKKRAKNEGPSLLDVVALLADIPAQRLARGQVGTSSLTTRLCSWSSATTKVVPTRSRPVHGQSSWSCTTSRKRPDHRTAAQKRTRARAVACSGVSGVPRSMKLDTIPSPCRYDAVAWRAFHSSKLRRNAILRYASRAPVLPISQGGPVTPASGLLNPVGFMLNPQGRCSAKRL